MRIFTSAIEMAIINVPNRKNGFISKGIHSYVWTLSHVCTFSCSWFCSQFVWNDLNKIRRNFANEIYKEASASKAHAAKWHFEVMSRWIDRIIVKSLILLASESIKHTHKQPTNSFEYSISNGFHILFVLLLYKVLCGVLVNVPRSTQSRKLFMGRILVAFSRIIRPLSIRSVHLRHTITSLAVLCVSFAWNTVKLMRPDNWLSVGCCCQCKTVDTRKL